MTPAGWRAEAACRADQRPDGVTIREWNRMFFPSQGESLEPAKQVCRGCGVRGECLEYALVETLRVGVWGGTAERERIRIRVARRRALEPEPEQQAS